ncbi:MAG: deoxyribodipyrimidine photo-lyase [Hyphomonadaceae bacterium]|nr:deoxyribodipyrimidine photo-lyase [Hyphomonadaceae bacterium]
MTGLHILWFRSDLRVHDHAALRAVCHSAARDGGAVMALYVFPENERELDVFLMDGLRDLQAALDRRGAQLHLRQGHPVEVLSELHRQHRILSVHTHETPTQMQSDRDVEAWAMRAGLPFRVYQQYGPLPTPNDFFDSDSSWESFMAEPRREAPEIEVAANVGVGAWPDMDRAFAGSEQSGAKGGRAEAIKLLRTLLGAAPPAGASPSAGQSGDAAFAALRPHLLLGTVSVREVWQAAISARQTYLRSGHEIRAAMIASFIELLPSIHADKYRRSEPMRRRHYPAQARDRAVGTQMRLGFMEPNGR